MDEVNPDTRHARELDDEPLEPPGMHRAVQSDASIRLRHRRRKEDSHRHGHCQRDDHHGVMHRG